MKSKAKGTKLLCNSATTIEISCHPSVNKRGVSGEAGESKGGWGKWVGKGLRGEGGLMSTLKKGKAWRGGARKGSNNGKMMQVISDRVGTKGDEGL